MKQMPLAKYTRSLSQIFFLCALVLLANISFCQQTTTSAYGSKTRVIPIKNKAGIAYNIHITLPPAYDESRSYDILYYVDGWWLNEMVKGIYAIQFLSQKAKPVILVGIQASGNEIAWHRQRTLDFTPSVYDFSKMKFTWTSGKIKVDSSNTGGAQLFLDFVEKEVIPLVESRYNAHADSRGFLGHSLGGLFGYYSLLSKSPLFKNYILISPSLWWNKAEWIDDPQLSKLIRKRANLFLCLGTSEIGMMKNPLEKLNRHLERTNTDLESYHFVKFDEENHNSVLPRAIYEGIKLFYHP